MARIIIDVESIIEQIKTEDLIDELGLRHNTPQEKVELIRKILSLKHLSTYEDICEGIKKIM